MTNEVLFQYGPWVALGATLLGIGIPLVRNVAKISFWLGKAESRLESFEKNIQAIHSDIQVIHSDIKKIHFDIQAIHSDIKKIFEILVSKKAVEDLSPLQLTEFGKKISSFAQADDWCREHAAKLHLHQDTEEYEIFDQCGKYIEKLFETDAKFEGTIKSAAYQHGVDAEPVLKVYQVQLRDEFLRQIGRLELGEGQGDEDG